MKQKRKLRKILIRNEIFIRFTFLFIFLSLYLLSLVGATELILQDADTENLEDIGTYSTNPSGGNYYSKWNISEIPSGSIINNISFYTYVTYTDSGDGAMTFYRITNQTWTEDGSGASYFSSISIFNQTIIDCGTPSASNWCAYNHENLTSMFQESLNNGDDSITIKMYAVTESNVGASDDDATGMKYPGPSSNNWVITTKEYATSSLRPYINITYTEPSDSTPPNVTSITESPTDPATYSYGQTYEFNATIIDDTAIDTVLLEFDGINYTATNLTTDVYNVTFNNLAVGTYNYRWYANDSYGNVNNSEIGSYTINKATPSFSTSLTSPITYGTASDYLGSESNSGDSDCTYILKREGVQIDTGSSVGDTDILGAGSYEYNYSTSGCSNYSAGSDVLTLTVNQAIPEGTLNNQTSLNLTYGEAFNFTYSESNNGDSDVTYTIYRDGTDISSEVGLNVTLGAGSYIYVLNTTGGVNWTSNTSMDTFTLTINKATPTGSLTSDLGWNINESQTVTIGLSESNTGDGDVTYVVYRDGVSKGTGETWSPTIGTYSYVLNTTGGANYTSVASLDAQTLEVNDTTFPLISINYPSNQTNSSLYDLNVNFTYFDLNVDSCWWTDDGGLTNNSNPSCLNLTGPWVDGWNHVVVYINDTSNNINSSSISFFIDGTSPIVNYGTGTENNNSFKSQDWIYINVSVTELHEDTIIFSLFNSSYDLVNSTSFTDSTRIINWTNLPEGVYYYNVSVNDTFGNSGSNITRKITLDITNPLITISSPTNGQSFDNFISSILINGNSSSTDINLDSCWYSISGSDTISNTSISCSSGVYSPFSFVIGSSGTSTLTVYSNDSAGNEQSSSANFNIISYSGPSSGGGSSSQPEERGNLSQTYNRDLVCEQVSNFIRVYGNGGSLPYTEEQYQNFKNNLIVLTGFGISDQVLKSYIHEFWINCPEYVENPDELNDNETGENESKSNYMIYIFIGLLFLFLILVGIIIYKNYLLGLLSNSK